MSHRLIPHPDTPPRGIRSIAARWYQPGNGTLLLRWHVDGVESLAVPPYSGKGRADDLWTTTCFELFLRDRAGGYREFNFSPSGRWAAWRFTGYREGMEHAEMADPPEMAGDSGAFLYALTVTVPMAVLDGADAAGMSAVIEEKDGTKSYWALAHAPGKPDFHDPACFALSLPVRRAVGGKGALA